MTDAYYRDRQLLLECLLRKPTLVSRHYPDLYRRVGALLAREDGTEAEHAALGAEHAALAAEVQDVLDHVAPRRSTAEALADGVVDLDQIAAMAHRHKDSFKRYKRRANDPLPDPDFPGGGGKRDYWRWATIRPWLVRNFNLPFPEQFPTLRPQG